MILVCISMKRMEWYVRRVFCSMHYNLHEHAGSARENVHLTVFNAPKNMHLFLLRRVEISTGRAGVVIHKRSFIFPRKFFFRVSIRIFPEVVDLDLAYFL